MAARAIAKSDIRDMTKVNIRYIAALLIVQFLSTYVPVVSFGLVHLFYGS
jgi:TRAP-type C4-dicarboxylate transport system permease large subunit